MPGRLKSTPCRPALTHDPVSTSFEPLETLPPIPPILRPSGCGLQLLQTFDFLPDRGERAVLQHDHEVPGFSGSAGCGSTVFLLPTFCSKQAASQHRTAIVEIALSLQRNVADSRFPIAPFLAIRICFGFRASNFGFPAPPGCAHRVSAVKFPARDFSAVCEQLRPIAEQRTAEHAEKAGMEGDWCRLPGEGRFWNWKLGPAKE